MQESSPDLGKFIKPSWKSTRRTRCLRWRPRCCLARRPWGVGYLTSTRVIHRCGGSALMRMVRIGCVATPRARCPAFRRASPTESAALHSNEVRRTRRRHVARPHQPGPTTVDVDTPNNPTVLFATLVRQNAARTNTTTPVCGERRETSFCRAPGQEHSRQGLDKLVKLCHKKAPCDGSQKLEWTKFSMRWRLTALADVLR